MRQGARPTSSTYACRSQSWDANEECTISSPPAGWWYVGIYVYSRGSTQITYTVTASH